MNETNWRNINTQKELSFSTDEDFGSVAEKMNVLLNRFGFNHQTTHLNHIEESIHVTVQINDVGPKKFKGFAKAVRQKIRVRGSILYK